MLHMRHGFAVLLVCAPMAVAAHPHAFTEVGYELVFNGDGHLTSLRTTWVYDDLFSLLVVEDGGYDTDEDGVISEAELAGLADFDSQWPEGYDGDLHVAHGDTPVQAGPPGDWAVSWVDGQLGSAHTRTFDPPLDPTDAPISISHYDPTYYVAYEIKPEPVITGREDCTIAVDLPDLDEAAQTLQEELAALGPSTSLEDAGFPEVGDLFAETAVLTCSG